LMERAALLAEHDLVSDSALAFGPGAAAAEFTRDIDGMTIDQAEAYLVRRALDRHNGNLQHAADALGITRQTLYRRLEKHSLRDPAADDAD
jgi:transcriptional regulator of acetoin/glycerol metabolism